MKRPDITYSPVNWDLRHAGTTKSIKIPCYNNFDLINEPTGELPIVLLLGYGERKRVGEAVLSVLGEQQTAAVAVDASLNYVAADRLIIEQAAAEVPHAVADDIKEALGFDIDELIKMIGHSGGGGMWAFARRFRPEGLGDAVLYAPVGFNQPEDLILSEKERTKEFLKRYAPNAFKQDFLDPATYPATLEVGGQILFDLLTRRFFKKIGFAVNNAVQRQALEHVNSGHRLGILTTDRDRIFRELEIYDALKACQKAGEQFPDFLTAQGPHVPMSSRHGLKQLKVATDYLLN